MTPGPDRFIAMLVAIIAAVSAACAAGCSINEQPGGFVGVGCYDHRNRFEPTIRTPGECRAASWVWRTEPWQDRVPAPVPSQ